MCIRDRNKDDETSDESRGSVDERKCFVLSFVKENSFESRSAIEDEISKLGVEIEDCISENLSVDSKEVSSEFTTYTGFIIISLVSSLVILLFASDIFIGI